MLLLFRLVLLVEEKFTHDEVESAILLKEVDQGEADHFDRLMQAAQLREEIEYAVHISNIPYLRPGDFKSDSVLKVVSKVHVAG